MQHFIAIDNVCAWPNLTVLPDGSVVAVVFDQPTHGRWEGDAACWGSTDQGRTWTFRGTATRHEPGTNRMNVGAGLAADGDLLVLCSGWTRRGRPGDTDVAAFGESSVLEATTSRSRDGGRTWDITRGALAPGPEALGPWVPFGDIAAAADGALCAGVYAFSLDHTRGHCAVARSLDDGRSWASVHPIVQDRHVEAALLHQEGARWLAAARVFGTLELDVYVSRDDAISWEPLCHLGVPGVSAAHLVLLDGGRIALTYGNRAHRNKGLDSRFSDDGGRTWSTPKRLVDLPPESDCGYPAAVQFPDGHVLIAYYSSRSAIHHRYHMATMHVDAGELGAP